MRIDVVSIFPDYLRVLDLSLPGKAREKGLLELGVHDLREWAHDRHRTVDDTPYGGGAGMVMKPEPWGEALDAVAPDGAILLVPTPSGRVFHQRLAEELAQAEHLVFACGRYEGIDQRVLEEATTRLRVIEVSLGDYVLNGGEVAALAIIEAVVRLIPGFMGNAESLAEESHTEGLLEYPVYTKPATWRGRQVPEVLLSGDHGRIADWRRQQARSRTAARRPDLLHPAAAVEVGDLAGTVRPAAPADVGELLTLQRAGWLREARENDRFDIDPLTESAEQVAAGLADWSVWVLQVGGRLVASVRARPVGTDWEVGRLMVAPDLQGRGLGRWLLAYAEAQAPAETTRMVLITGARSETNLSWYRKAGYRFAPDQPEEGWIVRLSKRYRPISS